MNAIQALKKAHQARAITRDTYSLKEFHTNEATKGRSQMTIVAIESKYVPSQDKRDLPKGEEGAGNLGFRTRFILADGSTIGTFSNSAHRFVEFFAGDVMGMDPSEPFLRVDVKGQIVVEISQEQIDNDRQVWNFEMIEEGSNVEGFANYVPDLTNVLQLTDGDFVDTATGEVNEAPEVQQASEKSTRKNKPDPKPQADAE